MQDIDISQDNLLRKVQVYLTQTKSTVFFMEEEPLDGGHCNGFTVCWLYKMAVGEEKEFFALLQRIACWDEKTKIEPDSELGTEFDEFISDIRRAQFPELHYRKVQPIIQQYQFYRICRNIADPEFKFILVDTPDNLTKIPFEFIPSNKMIYVSIETSAKDGHAIGIYCTKNASGQKQYFLYDANNSKEPEPIENSSSAITSLLSCYGLNKVERVGIKVQIFGLAGCKPAKYPEISTLVDKIDSVNAAESRGERTALFLAASIGFTDGVRALLGRDADANKKNNEGYTALDLVVYEKNYALALVIIKEAKQLQTETLNQALLILSNQQFQDDQRQVVQELLTRGADPDGLVFVFKENTLLHAAILQKNEFLVQLLLESGASVNIKNRAGETAIQLLANWDADLLQSNLLELYKIARKKNITSLADFCIESEVDCSPSEFRRWTKKQFRFSMTKKLLVLIWDLKYLYRHYSVLNKIRKKINSTVGNVLFLLLGVSFFAWPIFLASVINLLWVTRSLMVLGYIGILCIGNNMVSVKNFVRAVVESIVLSPFSIMADIIWGIYRVCKTGNFTKLFKGGVGVASVDIASSTVGASTSTVLAAVGGNRSSVGEDEVELAHVSTFVGREEAAELLTEQFSVDPEPDAAVSLQMGCR
jgi:ankyrin repeat protein